MAAYLLWYLQYAYLAGTGTGNTTPPAADPHPWTFPGNTLVGGRLPPPPRPTRLLPHPPHPHILTPSHTPPPTTVQRRSNRRHHRRQGWYAYASLGHAWAWRTFTIYMTSLPNWPSAFLLHLITLLHQASQVVTQEIAVLSSFKASFPRTIRQPWMFETSTGLALFALIDAALATIIHQRALPRPERGSPLY